MKISSPDFLPNEMIPTIYTCEGQQMSPPLAFHDIPPTAKSLVLIMDDPDVPMQVRKEQMYDHWIVFNISPSTTKIAANGRPPGLQGKNTNGDNQYIGLAKATLIGCYELGKNG